jgi:hypothetical protein
MEADHVGLCARCALCRLIEGARSTFYLCERSKTDPHYAKYPVLPVRDCPGFEAGAPDARISARRGGGPGRPADPASGKLDR